MRGALIITDLKLQLLVVDAICLVLFDVHKNLNIKQVTLFLAFIVILRDFRQYSYWCSYVLATRQQLAAFQQ
jgi:hypothetical protein